MVALQRVYPSLSFDQPLGLLQAPGDDTRWFVVEQPGRVLVFVNDPSTTNSSVFADITARVDSGPGEAGLLGLAFHPNFALNGEVFVSYTRSGSPLVSYVSRFRSQDGGQTLDTTQEEVILTVDQDFGNHNGGNIAFGPDGLLYIGMGDGGSGGDPNERAQDTGNLLGAMLRIDVDGVAPYAIPPDNPFVANASCASGDCPEIYAWGLRNPWRWSFDSATGRLSLGDVGQNTWEEVDIIELGGNYGWDCREGAHDFELAGCPAGGLIDPVAEYDHSLGNSITGGYVYRGTALPALQGRYLFGDFGSGRLWGLEENGSGGYDRLELLASNLGISSFGQGLDGEVYVVDYFGGGLHQIVDGGGGAGTGVEPLLSDTGCVDTADATQPATGLIPYRVNAAFWSDAAVKQRWMAVPDGQTIAIGADGDWDFPAGSVLLKHFELGGRRVETRLFMRHPDGVWAGYSYEWNPAGSDAELVVGGKTANINGQDWIFPSSGECLLCHTAAAGFSLGLETQQLNSELQYPST